MSDFLLFCIAQVPRNTINTLLQTPRHNFFSLVRTPDQTTFDLRQTKSPLRPFETGFLNYARESIRMFITVNLPDALPGTNLEPGQYALLDERSAADNTVVLGHSYSTLEMQDPESMTEDKVDQWSIECEEHGDDPDDAWREWRVRFEDAEKLSTHLCSESDFTPKLYNDDFVARYTNEEGVFNLPQAYQEYLEARI